ncbi:MAG TPA: YncE family protein [Opitutaceae bacterium]|nr:YncE family protein [Lacunisphaera sp.]HWA09083.1 YncE family protein [Opitutaceae bacterium]
MNPALRLLAPVFLGLLGPALVPAVAADGPYHFIKEIPVGGDGGWDYLTMDSASHRLYLSHGNVVAVVDTQTDKVVGQVDDTPGVHGFAVVPKLGRGFSSNGRENKVNVVDLATLKTLSKVDVGQNPDWIFWEPGQNEIYTFNGRSHNSTVLAADSGKVVATIELGGKPETAMADPSINRVFDNIEDKNEIVVIDTKSHTVVNHWPIAPNAAASGLAIDLAHKRIFLGCGDSNTMAMMDYTSGKIVASVPIGAGVDACSFDPGTQLAFSSCGGSGTVTIAHEDGADKLTVVQTLTTEKGARTMTLDPATHRIYLASAKYLAAAQPAAGGARGRPQMVPGSFKVLVYGTDK